jgi:hypothetical protein
MASRTTELDCRVEASFNVAVKIHGSIDPHVCSFSETLEPIRLSTDVFLRC